MKLLKKSLLILGCCLVAIGAGVILKKSIVSREVQFPIYPEYVVDIGKSYKEDITFLIADVRYKEGSIKFLELGASITSSFSGYNNYFHRGILWDRFWLFLKQLNLPIWFVSFKPLESEGAIEKARTKYGITTLEKEGGHFCPSFKQLAQDAAFLRCEQKPVIAMPGQFNYKGIVVARLEHAYTWDNVGRYYACQCENCVRARMFRSQHKDVLFIDEASHEFAINKNLMATLFSDEPLSVYRPHYKIIKKRYTPVLADDIIREFKSDVFVIKPLNTSMGRGIVIVPKNNLDMMLKYIINKPIRLKDLDDPSYKYWASDKNDMLIVESYESSKPVTVENKQYDATLRVVYTLHYLDGKIHLNFLGEYWKLPIKSLDERGTLTEKHKSNMHGPGVRSLLVSPSDTAEIHEILKKALPLMYEKMLKRESSSNSY